MVGLSASFGWLSLLLCTTGTTIGVAYSLWFKRTRLAWLPYLLALPLLPIWVWIAFDRNPGRMLLLYPLGIPAIFSIYLSQSLPDIAADRLGGVRNLPVLLGERRTLLICWGAMLGAAAVLALVSVRLAARPVAAWGAACLAAGLVACDVFLYTRNRRQGISACFPCMAVAGAGLGVGWVLSITS
jgi:4-hydroxybenzoate polyprenyltransferase